MLLGWSWSSGRSFAEASWLPHRPFACCRAAARNAACLPWRLVRPRGAGFAASGTDCPLAARPGISLSLTPPKGRDGRLLGERTAHRSVVRWPQPYLCTRLPARPGGVRWPGPILRPGRYVRNTGTSPYPSHICTTCVSDILGTLILCLYHHNYNYAVLFNSCIGDV